MMTSSVSHSCCPVNIPLLAMYNLVRQGRMQKDNGLEFLLGKIVRKYINFDFLFHSLNNIFIHHIT